MAINDEDYINKMYDGTLNSQKETLKQNYDQSVSDLDTEQQKAQKQTDANLTRTYVEAAKNQKNYNEVQNAYGLASGARAQARLAQDNQLTSNLTAIRAAQQETDAEVERQRSLLAKEYQSAIAKAQADNDLQRAQALYQAAKDDEDALLQQQKEAASLMASAGDYSLYQALYGLTDAQLAKLQGTSGAASGSGSTSGGSGVYYGSGGVDDEDAPEDELEEEPEDAQTTAAKQVVTNMLNSISKQAEKKTGTSGTSASSTAAKKIATSLLNSVSKQSTKETGVSASSGKGANGRQVRGNSRTTVLK